MGPNTHKLPSAVLDSIDSQIAVIDQNGTIGYVNRAWIEFGRANGLEHDFSWPGVNYFETCRAASMGGDGDAAQVLAGMKSVIGGATTAFHHEYPCHSPDEKRWFMMSFIRLRGVVDTFVTSHHLITDRKQAEERIELQNLELARLAVTDKLTQLFNRTKLDEILEYEIARAARGESGFSIVILDIDRFKPINDRFGHAAGDQVLREVAGLLQSHARRGDAVGRWGGEEFLIVLPAGTADGAHHMAELLRTAIADHRFPVVGRVTCSYGIAAYRPGQTAIEVLADADSALYRAKRGGRNRGEVACRSGKKQ